ncbi:hypothetical protein Ahy_B04g073703 [Arachis hypogaea]|uniref:F-box associated beta-propeller type 1 domain-containing protein n=1 Tax=Arachis hypogaea TaxID=3818 RepID=A0A444ZR62_ARAHY|nr:hypothetical protein Ahy_B04g073703 [Arachis hypogaea]
MGFNFHDHAILFGFGYDASQDDYLVVLAWENSQLHVHCFSLKTNSWINLDAALPKPLGHKMWQSRGLFLHGAIHWLTCYGAYMNAILIFDLKERSFSTTSVPVKHYNEYSGLTLLGGCLTLFSYDHVGKTYIWVMKEYKVTSSWILMYDIHCFKPMPLSLSNGSDIIALLSTTKLKFAKYNVSGELFQEIDYPPLCYRRGRNLLTFFVYTESLLPFPADTKDKDKKKKTDLASSRDGKIPRDPRIPAGTAPNEIPNAIHTPSKFQPLCIHSVATLPSHRIVTPYGTITFIASCSLFAVSLSIDGEWGPVENGDGEQYSPTAGNGNGDGEQILRRE